MKLDGRAVVLGEGRADTPGQSSKFGCYSVLDLDEGIVADIQLVQVNNYIFCIVKFTSMFIKTY